LSTPPVRPVRLPDRFYLPRRSYSGQEVFDALPWEDATEYVTDGERYGFRLQDGAIRWFEESRLESFAADFSGVDLESVVEGLREYCRRYRILQGIWRDDIETLDRLRSDRAEEDPSDPVPPASTTNRSRHNRASS